MSSIDILMLAHILDSKQNAMEVSKSITYDYFDPKTQWLYKAVMKHFTNPNIKELPTRNAIQEYLEKNYPRKKFVEEGIKLFDKISAMNPDQKEFTWHLNKLRTKYNDRLQRACVNDVSMLMRENKDVDDRVVKINDTIRKSMTEIETIHRKEAYKEGPLNESARDRATKYKAVEANPDLARGILTGFDELDRVTNGLHGGELILIGGQSSTGKSVVMHNIAVHAWLGGYNPLEKAPSAEDTLRGENVLYFSIEMPKDNQERRLDACISDIPYKDIRDGKLSSGDKEKFFKVLKFQKNYIRRFHIVDMPRGVTVREIELKHIELEEKYGIKFGLTVADYLGIMEPTNPQSSDWLKLGVISEEFHEYARTYNIPALSAVQLNRPKDPTKQVHSTDRVARSDMIPANANVILQIGCRGEDEHTRTDMPIYGTKIRDGEKTSFTMIKNFANMRITNMTDESFADDDDDDEYDGDDVI